MRRREFLSVVGGAAAWPLAVRAQQPAMAVVGFLHIASAGPMSHLVAAFRDGLKEQGFVEGQNVVIEFRWADGQYDRMPPLAADLVGKRAAVIATGGNETTVRAIRAASATVPIVFNTGSDPVKAGMVASLSRPGGNATGVNILTVELEAKRLGLLHELVPKGAAIALLVNPNYPPTDFIINSVEAAAQTLGRTILVLKAANEREIDVALNSLPLRQARGLIVAADPFFNSRRDQIVLWATRHAVPAAYEQREFALAGGLMSYGTSLTDAYRQVGIYTGRILNGEKPANLPVMQLAKFQLVVNLKTARVLGLTLPSGLLSIIDEVIE